jgi:hypothetical protein
MTGLPLKWKVILDVLRLIIKLLFEGLRGLVVHEKDASPLVYPTYGKLHY